MARRRITFLFSLIVLGSLLLLATPTRAQCGEPPDPWSTFAQYQRVCAKYGGHIENQRCVGWDTNWCHRGETTASSATDDRAKEDARLAEERRAEEARRRAEENAETKRKQEEEARKEFEREKKDALNSLKGTSSGTLELKGADSRKSNNGSSLRLKDMEETRKAPTSNSTVVDLAGNPSLAKMYMTELQAVRGRNARLHKALDILKKTDKEASRAWDDLHEEILAQSHEIDWQTFLFVTAGLGQVLKLATAQMMQKVEAIRRHAIWTEVPVETARLQRLMTSADETNRKIISEVLGTINRVEAARVTENNVELLNRYVEGMKVIQERMAHLTGKGIDPKTVDALYESMAFMGRMAIVFGTGIVAKLSVAASFAEPFAETAAIYALIVQEEGQFRRMSRGFVDRQTMRREIHRRLGEVENRERLLVTEIGRLDPAANVGPK